MFKALRACAAAAPLLAAATPGWALTVDNITYSLSSSLVSTSGSLATHSLTLDIVNNSNDGRTGFTSFAFSLPTGFVSATLPGWTTQAGGLNANGCSGSGNFFCFSGYAAAAPTMSLTFSLTAAASALASYTAPSFKIDWIGSQRNYNLVSQPLAVTTPVPEPETYALMLAGIGFVAAAARRRRRAD
jgi:hypothetical protein